ncbi:staphylopine family metallophore export MFS transporter CntE [Paenibacillus sp. MMS18-CY102]|uniref:staphylopine family metallophore export MFS transporter CntE n=1 Tax=Paenibacillus sp. MMS18-CY102 TaxID=2682849 RepID=UPI001365A39E|nr:MFS transporter [Paenibacillus sp. MMS18-CY102]MWC28125.1 MFS transporter [Paenibacillus sp. MMS18-CY102]
MGGALSWPFMRLYILTLLYFSANAILNVIIPLKGESLGASNSMIGLIMGAYLFTTMIFRPWAGNWIRKHGPIRVLRIILVVNGAALVLYTLTGLEGYLAARMLQGVCTAFFSMALQLGIIDALPDKERSQGISLYSLCATLPGMIGPLLAIGMWEAGDKAVFPSAMIAIAILTGVVGYSARVKPNAAEQESGRSARDQGATMLQSFGQLYRNRQLLKCSVLMLVASVVFGAVTTFMPLYASQIAGGNAALYLMLQAGTVVIARFALRKRIPSDGRWHSAFVMALMLQVAVAALSVSYSATGGASFLYAGAALMGLAQALIYPALTTYLTFVLPPINRNVLIGLFIAMADLGVSLGGFLMGPIADVFSYAFMYMICAGLGASMIAVAYERRKQVGSS